MASVGTDDGLAEAVPSPRGMGWVPGAPGVRPDLILILPPTNPPRPLRRCGNNKSWKDSWLLYRGDAEFAEDFF